MGFRPRSGARPQRRRPSTGAGKGFPPGVGGHQHRARRESACKPGSVGDSHSSRAGVTASLKRPTRGHARAARRGTKPLAPLFGLAPGGVYPAADVAAGAVRSYRTISPLPTRRGGFRRCLFCGTFRRLTPPRRYLAPCPAEPGLSSPRAAWAGGRRLSGRLPKISITRKPGGARPGSGPSQDPRDTEISSPWDRGPAGDPPLTPVRSHSPPGRRP